jgi:hypothetical protein
MMDCIRHFRHAPFRYVYVPADGDTIAAGAEFGDVIHVHAVTPIYGNVRQWIGERATPDASGDTSRYDDFVCASVA